MSIRRGSVLVAALAALLLAVCTALMPGRLSTAAARPRAALSQTGTALSQTGTADETLLDAITVPALNWQPCRKTYLCATALVPLDYRRPNGPTIRLALLKAPATDPARRIGSLFLNPGGPGGSGRDVVVAASGFVSDSVRARFDLIGMDPRGTNGSTRIQCYPDASAQAVDTAVLDAGIPTSSAAERRYRTAADGLADACAATGMPLAASMSTTQVARDLDLLRRAVGDRQLSYLGWSYGTYLGEVYALLFPGRVRAVAIDGVIDPVAWQGTAATADLPMTYRMNPGAGSSRALTALLRRCRAVGAPRCPLMPNPQAAFDRVAASLKADPLTVDDPEGSYQIGYADFLHEVLLALYQPDSLEDVPTLVQALQQLIDAGSNSSARIVAAIRYRGLQQRFALDRSGRTARLANDWEVNAAVSCSDSRNPTDGRRWSALADAADRRAPYFGRYWLWLSASCAHWSATDDQAYRGDFDRPTAHPVLVVGNTYDPATPYEAAVATAHELPNSRLLLSDSWGHTAYGNSACATTAIDRYLLSGVLPAAGTVCRGAFQPFS